LTVLTAHSHACNGLNARSEADHRPRRACAASLRVEQQAVEQLALAGLMQMRNHV
jgi:hypothetical protein